MCLYDDGWSIRFLGYILCRVFPPRSFDLSRSIDNVEKAIGRPCKSCCHYVFVGFPPFVGVCRCRREVGATAEVVLLPLLIKGGGPFIRLPSIIAG